MNVKKRRGVDSHLFQNENGSITTRLVALRKINTAQTFVEYVKYERLQTSACFSHSKALFSSVSTESENSVKVPAALTRRPTT